MTLFISTIGVIALLVSCFCVIGIYLTDHPTEIRGHFTISMISFLVSMWAFHTLIP